MDHVNIKSREKECDIVFYYLNSLQNIKRNKVKSMACICISCVLIVLINVYVGSIYSVKKQLYELAETTHIDAHISNLNGTQRLGLSISERIYENLDNSPHVNSLKCSLRLMGGFGVFDMEDYRKHLDIDIIAINDIGAFKEEALEVITLAKDREIDFLEKSEFSCIVNEDLMNERGLKIGDSILLTIYYYEYDSDNMLKGKLLDIREYQIIGSIKESLSEEMEEIKVILPLKTIQEMYQQEGIEFIVNSLSFNVANPLELNEFKEEMKSFELLPIIPSANFSVVGNALNVKDGTFISSARQLRTSEELLQNFLPIIVMLIMLVGYVVSLLLMKSRKDEIRLMKIIGTSKTNIVKMLWNEQFFLSSTGAVVAAVFVRKIEMVSMSQVIIVIVGVCFSYCVGALIAIIKISKRNIMGNTI